MTGQPPAEPPCKFTPLFVQVRGGTVRTVGGWVAITVYGLLALGSLVLKHSHLPALTLFGLIFSGTIAARRWRIRGVAVSVEDDVLTIHRRRTLRWHLPAIREGWLESPGDRVAACIRTVSGETLVLWFDQETTAKHLLIAARVDANQKAIEWRVASPVRGARTVAVVLATLIWTVVYLVFLAITMTIGYKPLGLLVPPLLLMGWALVRVRRVQIGIDGLVLVSFVRRRFVDYRDIERVSEASVGEDVVLELTHGRQIAFAPGYLDDRNRVVASATRRMQFANLVQAHLDVLGHITHSDRVRTLLERRSEPLPDWRKRIRQLALGGYRERAVSPEDFGAVLDSASATPEQRIGAVLVLVDSGAFGYRDRVRVAADRCAEPKLRVALERVSTGEIEELDGLLADDPALAKAAAKSRA